MVGGNCRIKELLNFNVFERQKKMAVEIRVPELGESIVDAVIASWLKHEGDMVKKGDALVELETDKVNVEVSVEQSGVLQQIIKQEGDEVTVGDVLGMIGESVEESAGTRSESPTKQPAQQAKTNGQSPSTGQAQPAPIMTDGQKQVSPLARRIAAEYNVDLSQVKGNNPHGRVTRDDVINYMEKTSTQQAPAASTITAPVSQQPQSASSATATPVVPSPVREVTPVPTATRPPIQLDPPSPEKHSPMTRGPHTSAHT